MLLDAGWIHVTLRGGRKAPAKLVGLDLESGLGVIKLEGPGPWPAAALGDSTKTVAGEMTGTVGLDSDGSLVAVPGKVQALAPWTTNESATTPVGGSPPLSAAVNWRNGNKPSVPVPFSTLIQN